MPSSSGNRNNNNGNKNGAPSRNTKANDAAQHCANERTDDNTDVDGNEPVDPVDHDAQNIEPLDGDEQPPANANNQCEPKEDCMEGDESGTEDTDNGPAMINSGFESDYAAITDTFYRMTTSGSASHVQDADGHAQSDNADLTNGDGDSCNGAANSIGHTTNGHGDITHDAPLDMQHDNGIDTSTTCADNMHPRANACSADAVQEEDMLDTDTDTDGVQCSTSTNSTTVYEYNTNSTGKACRAASVPPSNATLNQAHSQSNMDGPSSSSCSSAQAHNQYNNNSNVSVNGTLVNNAQASVADVLATLSLTHQKMNAQANAQLVQYSLGAQASASVQQQQAAINAQLLHNNKQQIKCSNSNNNHAQPLQNAAAVARAQAAQHQPVALPAPNALPLHNQAQPPLGWQATKQSLKERFSFMFCNEILADVHFLVGRGEQRQRIPAHKFVLSVGSAVFDAMFNGPMGQSQEHQDDIELPDVEAAAFVALLKFLYSDDVQIGPESVMTTLYTAKKYAVPALENACVDFLKKNLSFDNAFMLLTQARLFDEPQLAALCLETIDKHTAEALSAEGFTDIDLETLCAVLERDTLRIREAVLFGAVVRWSTQECHRQQLPVTPDNQRQLLARALTLIRFPLMTVEEFAQTVAQLGILNDRELVNLFLYFTVNPKPPVAFMDVPRCCVTGKEQVVNRFQRIEGRWGYSGTPDRIKFTVDRRIFIVGFGMYGSIHGPTEYQVNIQLIHCGTGKILGSNDTTFPCDGSSGTFRVLFKEAVEISPCVTYIASACLKGPDSHYGTKGLRRIVHQSPSSGCVTFQFTYAAGNNNGTSVEDGQIPEIIFYTKLT